MQYLLLICDDEQKFGTLSEAELATRHQGWNTLTQDLIAANKLRGGERLRPTATATTLRVNNGQRLLSDGPFAETKEQLGGFYVVEADNLDEAVDWAAKMPHLAGGGVVEIRPIWPME
jgi:hypothetical protein